MSTWVLDMLAITNTQPVRGQTVESLASLGCLCHCFVACSPGFDVHMCLLIDVFICWMGSWLRVAM